MLGYFASLTGYDAERFSAIENGDYARLDKPLGGLWLSVVSDAWLRQCEGWRDVTVFQSIELKADANILVIDSVERCELLLHTEDGTIDWEFYAEQYDAALVTWQVLMNPLYGWDVETILVFNQSAIQSIDTLWSVN